MKHLKSFKTLCTGRKAESQSSQVQGKFLTGPKGSFTLAKFAAKMHVKLPTTKTVALLALAVALLALASLGNMRTNNNVFIGCHIA